MPVEGRYLWQEAAMSVLEVHEFKKTRTFYLNPHQCPRESLCQDLLEAFENSKSIAKEIYAAGCPKGGITVLMALTGAVRPVPHCIAMKGDVHEGLYKLPLVYMVINVSQVQLQVRQKGDDTVDVAIKPHPCGNPEACVDLKETCRRAAEGEERKFVKAHPGYHYVSVIALWTLAERVPTSS
jgi:hypothetical protein